MAGTRGVTLRGVGISLLLAFCTAGGLAHARFVPRRAQAQSEQEGLQAARSAAQLAGASAVASTTDTSRQTQPGAVAAQESWVWRYLRRSAEEAREHGAGAKATLPHRHDDDDGDLELDETYDTDDEVDTFVTQKQQQQMQQQEQQPVVGSGSKLMGWDAAEAAEAWTRHHQEQEQLQGLMDDVGLSQGTQQTAAHAPLALPELAVSMLRGMLLRHTPASDGAPASAAVTATPRHHHHVDDYADEDGDVLWTMDGELAEEEQQQLRRAHLQHHAQEQKQRAQRLDAALVDDVEAEHDMANEDEDGDREIGGGLEEWEREASAARDAALLGPLALLRGMVEQLVRRAAGMAPGRGVVVLLLQGAGAGAGHGRPLLLPAMVLHDAHQAGADGTQRLMHQQRPQAGYWGSLDLEDHDMPGWVDDNYYYVEGAVEDAAAEAGKEARPARRGGVPGQQASAGGGGGGMALTGVSDDPLFFSGSASVGSGAVRGAAHHLGPQHQQEGEDEVQDDLASYFVLTSPHYDDQEDLQHPEVYMVEQRLTWAQWARSTRTEPMPHGCHGKHRQPVTSWSWAGLLGADGSVDPAVLLLVALLLATACMLIGLARSLRALQRAMAATRGAGVKGAKGLGQAWRAPAGRRGMLVRGAQAKGGDGAGVAVGGGVNPLLVPFVMEGEDGSQQRGYMLLSEENVRAVAGGYQPPKRVGSSDGSA